MSKKYGVYFSFLQLYFASEAGTVNMLKHQGILLIVKESPTSSSPAWDLERLQTDCFAIKNPNMVMNIFVLLISAWAFVASEVTPGDNE